MPHTNLSEEDWQRTRKLQSRYDSWTQRNQDAAANFQIVIKEILSDSGLAFDAVTARVKSFRSFRAKALRRGPDGSYDYADPWQEIHDLVGVRVTTYHSTEIPDIVDALSEDLTIVRTIDKTAETRVAGQLGYGSHHLICRVDEFSPTELEPYRGLLFEVQVRTVLQHAWAEFEHDIRYKSSATVSDPRIDRAFALAAGLIELADQQFDQVAQIVDEQRNPSVAAQSAELDTQSDGANADSNATLLSAETLPGVLTMLLPTFPRSKSDHYQWLEELLRLNDITTVGELRELVGKSCVTAVEKAMRYSFQPGHVRIVDDLLLAKFGRTHIDATENVGEHPARRHSRLRMRYAQLLRGGAVTKVRECGIKDH